MKRKVIIFLLLIIGLIFYYLLNSNVISISNVPSNYQQCIKTIGSKFNKTSCSIFYQDSSIKVSECLSLGGCNPAAADGPKGCKIGFINPDFKYPLNVDGCIDLKKGRNSNSERSIVDLSSGGIKECWIFLNSTCKGDQLTVENIMNNCPSEYKYNEQDYGHTFVRICEKIFR